MAYLKVPKLIAVCGYKRCGKDTLAEYISQQYGHKHIKISSKLKDVVKVLFNFNDDQIETDSKEVIDERWGVTPRNVLQFVGTEMFQYKIQEMLPCIKRNFWIKSIVEEHIQNANQPIVISDMRFLHEYNELKKYDVFVIKIKREHSYQNRDMHPSETEFVNIPANLDIENNGTISEMWEKVRKDLIKVDNTETIN